MKASLAQDWLNGAGCTIDDAEALFRSIADLVRVLPREDGGDARIDRIERLAMLGAGLCEQAGKLVEESADLLDSGTVMTIMEASP